MSCDFFYYLGVHFGIPDDVNNFIRILDIYSKEIFWIFSRRFIDLSQHLREKGPIEHRVGALQEVQLLFTQRSAVDLQVKIIGSLRRKINIYSSEDLHTKIF